MTRWCYVLDAIQTLVGSLYPIITGLAELSTLINLTNRDASKFGAVEHLAL